MNIDKTKIEALGKLLKNYKKNVVLVAHTNPDGDAVGSLTAWSKALKLNGIECTCIVPNRVANFLLWLEDANDIKVFKNDKDGTIAQSVNDAELIICLDFNQPSRLDELGELITANTKAKKVLIDHHLSPPNIYDVSISYPDSSSTCYLVYTLIEAIYGTELINKAMAESLYVGMMTDTGNFSFANLEPDLFKALAVLASKGIDIPAMHRNLYNQFSEGRLRLLGYTINNKLKIIEPHKVAYMTLSESELRRFNFELGDSEGFVNYPLSIGKVNFSVLFTQASGHIKISFRSQGDIDVNQFARKYFNGGGHRNASGGRSYWSMTKTVNYFIKCVEEFYSF